MAGVDAARNCSVVKGATPARFVRCTEAARMFEIRGCNGPAAAQREFQGCVLRSGGSYALEASLTRALEVTHRDDIDRVLKLYTTCT